MEEAIGRFCRAVFYPILSPVFSPIDRFLARFYQPWATICAVSLFLGTMIWVSMILNEKYVNRGRPFRSPWTDLRLWTVISMLPHVLVYFYLR